MLIQLKLLNFTEKLKQRGVNINMVTWSFLPFRFAVFLTETKSYLSNTVCNVALFCSWIIFISHNMGFFSGSET